MSGSLFTTGSRFGTLPKLLAGGTNWVSYRDQMEQFLLGHPGARKHLTGRVKAPAAPAAPKVKDAEKPTTEEEKALSVFEAALEDYEDAMDDYLQKEA